MIRLTASEARKALFQLIQQVSGDDDHVVITSKHGNAVLISEAAYNSMKETEYLTRSPANVCRLLDAKGSVRRGRDQERRVIDIE